MIGRLIDPSFLCQILAITKSINITIVKFAGPYQNLLEGVIENLSIRASNIQRIMQ